MDYLSTRSDVRIPADEALFGLPDSAGGLAVPERWPDLSEAGTGSTGYPDLATRVAAPFLSEVVTESAVRAVAQAAYERFTFPEVVRLVEAEPGLYLMELFWGPTLAFKDLALQFLAGLLQTTAKAASGPVLVLGATSGDTGAAAIEAFRGRPGVEVAILHPHGLVTDVQRRFMTTTGADNVTNLAVDGTFDDCQAIVRDLLADPSTLAPLRPASANSINFIRVVGQVTYYAAATYQLGEARFSVPTGNFGNAYSGYVARRCGLAVKRIVVANNRNRATVDLLASRWNRALSAASTVSPAMDIRLPGNFERVVFEAFDRDADRVLEWADSGDLQLPGSASDRLAEDFGATPISEEETLSTIADHYHKTGTMIDPHTAVALAAARNAPPAEEPTVVLATAHPAKFPEAVSRATGAVPALPERFQDQLAAPEQFEVVPADAAAVRERLLDTA